MDAELFLGLADGAVADHVNCHFGVAQLVTIFDQADQQHAVESEKLGRQFEAKVALYNNERMMGR